MIDVRARMRWGGRLDYVAAAVDITDVDPIEKPGSVHGVDLIHRDPRARAGAALAAPGGAR